MEAWSSYQQLSLYHLGVYQTTNLIKYGASIHYETPAADNINIASNLIENLENRSNTLAEFESHTSPTEPT